MLKDAEMVGMADKEPVNWKSKAALGIVALCLAVSMTLAAIAWSHS